ncbi:MAG: YqgE/AlgH family protein [Porticoccaceae bacterium]|nr:YqgE/AlgH family protein [Porticoccaceae bacterium]
MPQPPPGADEATNLRGQLLIAMPGLLDPNFVHSVVYICQHSAEGAMGIAINRPLGLPLSQVFEQLNLDYTPKNGTQTLLCGGPVEEQQGFVLHRPAQKQWQATAAISEEILLTTSRDIIDDMASNQGPDATLVALGYAGWVAGQLEQELLDNAWLTVPANGELLPQLLFDTPLEQRADLAAASIGVNLSQLSNSTGHA